MRTIILTEAKKVIENVLDDTPHLKSKYSANNPPRLRSITDVEKIFEQPEIRSIEGSEGTLQYLKALWYKEQQIGIEASYGGRVGYNYIVNMAIIILLFKSSEMGGGALDGEEFSINEMFDGLVTGLFQYYTTAYHHTLEDPKTVVTGRWVNLPQPINDEMGMLFPQGIALKSLIDVFNESVGGQERDDLSILIPLMVTVLVLNFPLIDVMERNLQNRLGGVTFEISNLYGFEVSDSCVMYSTRLRNN